MISPTFRSSIGELILLIGEPYDMLQRASYGGQAEVHDHFVGQILALSIEARRDILTKMSDCWKNEQSYDRIRDWGRAMVGTATLLAFDTKAESNLHWTLFADVIVRLARWQHSTHHWYTPMRDYAKDIGQSVWAQMPDLIHLYGDSDRVVYFEGSRFKLKQFGAKNSRLWITEQEHMLRPTNQLFVDPGMRRPLQGRSFDGELSSQDLFQIIGFDPRTRQAVS